MAGQVVMQGFIHRRDPALPAPRDDPGSGAFDPRDRRQPDRRADRLQVVLSFGIPFALVPLVMIASQREIMGALVNPRWLSALAGAMAALIIALNVFLLEQVFLG